MLDRIGAQQLYLEAPHPTYHETYCDLGLCSLTRCYLTARKSNDSFVVCSGMPMEFSILSKVSGCMPSKVFENYFCYLAADSTCL